MISVIIPCYNASEFIKETLISILDQDIDAIEIVIIDDGSTDSSASIIKSINHPRVTYIYQQNKGVSVARNNGFQQAKGEYIIFFDADDKMSLDFLIKRKSVLDNNKDIGFCCSYVETFPLSQKRTFGIVDNVAEGLLTYKPEYSSCPSNYLIRKSILVDFGIRFNEKLSSTADRFFLIELANKSKGMLIDESPLLYRISPDSMSNNLSQKLFLDNEMYFWELKKHGLIPKQIENEFVFKIQYILGLGFLRTRLYKRGLKYTSAAFFRNPQKFIYQII